MVTAMVMGMVAKVISNNKQSLCSLCILLSGVAVLFSMPLTAGDWKISPHLSVRGTYTDNADLSSSDEESEFYTQVTPAVTIKREGAGRVQADIDYALDYTENRPGNRGRSIAHSLGSNLQAELYKDVIFLDASAGAHLSSATSGGQRGSDSVGNVSDPIQTYTYTLSPYFKHHFGRYIDTLTRYTFDQVVNSGRGGSDSYNNQVLLSINSGPYFTRVPWGLSYRQSKTNNEDGAADSETTSLNGNVSYIVNRKWRINLNGGKVDNDIQSSRSSTDGFTWDAGATWTPNPRTDMNFSYGHQVFGQSFAFDFNHRWRRAVWRASYNKTLTDSRSQQIAQGSAYRAERADYGATYLAQDAYEYSYFGETTGSDGKPIYLYKRDFDYATLTDEHYVIETLNTGFTLETHRSNFSIDAHFTRREYEVSRNKGRDIGINANWSRQLTPKTDAKVALSWQKNRADENATEDTRWTVNLGLSKRLTENTSANLDYKHSRLNSTDSTGEYKENQLSLSLASKW